MAVQRYQGLRRERLVAQNNGASSREIEHAAPGRLEFEWADLMPDDCWATYRDAMRVMEKLGIDFLLGGGFALAAFTGRWRDTKDIDFYIRKRDREKVIAALAAAGFEDYYNTLAYDRNWIYRSVRSGVIVDVIWSMANQRAQVDDEWFAHARPVVIRGQELKVVPLEEFVWCKLYIIQRDHCDWTDIFNVMCTSGEQVDWKRLLGRLEEDAPLLKGVLTVYDWLRPEDARKLPASLWKWVGLPVPDESPAKPRYDRVRLLDSRAWFAALLPKGGKLAV